MPRIPPATGLSTLCAAWASITMACSAAMGDLPPFSHYSVILDRKPFGDILKPAEPVAEEAPGEEEPAEPVEEAEPAEPAEAEPAAPDGEACAEPIEEEPEEPVKEDAEE